MVWVLWNCRVHPQWHTFCSEATPPNPSPTVSPTGDRVFKHECWRPQSPQRQARHGREQLEKEASWSHLSCTQETTIRELCIIYICVYNNDDNNNNTNTSKPVPGGIPLPASFHVLPKQCYQLDIKDSESLCWMFSFKPPYHLYCFLTWKVNWFLF